MSKVRLNIGKLLKVPRSELNVKLQEMKKERIKVAKKNGKNKDYYKTMRQTDIYWHYVNYFLVMIQAIVDFPPVTMQGDALTNTEIWLDFPDEELGWEERLVYRATERYGERIHFTVDEDWNSKYKKLKRQYEAALFNFHSKQIEE